MVVLENITVCLCIYIYTLLKIQPLLNETFINVA